MKHFLCWAWLTMWYIIHVHVCIVFEDYILIVLYCWCKSSPSFLLVYWQWTVFCRRFQYRVAQGLVGQVIYWQLSVLFYRRFQYRVAQGLVGQVEEEEMDTCPSETRTALGKLKTVGKKRQAPVSRIGNIHQGTGHILVLVSWLVELNKQCLCICLYM